MTDLDVVANVVANVVAKSAHGQPIPEPTDAPRAQAHALLLAWYASAGRDLPWRHSRDPYAILVSEVMLQQTQVERVLPKYREFLRLFPTLADLAATPAADVIRAWSPLGYNVRAVRLREIARQVVANHGGALPQTLDGLLSLKGIGRYTAGAIACFAFGVPVATVDTNIHRVLWRIFRGVEPEQWPTGQSAAREHLALAEWALPAERAYDWQQALMDLGATICVSRQPACERCPVARTCAAYAEVAHVALFPNGEALAQLRAARAAQPEAATASSGQRVAEHQAGYDAGDSKTPSRVLRRRGTSIGQAHMPFTQSSRYFRGRVLAALRALDDGASLSIDELGPLVKPGWTPSDHAWLRTLVRGLARDGLVSTTENAEGGSEDPRVALP